jgi:hypothetical protein
MSGYGRERGEIAFGEFLETKLCSRGLMSEEIDPSQLERI